MTANDVLQGMDPHDLMDQEAARLEAGFSRLDEAEWARPSRCEGWSARDVLAHLMASEEYHQACLDGTVQDVFAKYAELGIADLHQFNQAGVRALDGVPNDRLIAQWAQSNADTRRRFRERGDGVIDSSVGDYPARLQAFHLTLELSTHGDDAFLPVPASEAAARRAWRARVSRFALAESKPEVAVTELGSGGYRVEGPDSTSVEVSEADFVEGVAGRLPADDDRFTDAQRALLSTMPT
jgi:uncharacterized protein (TIGR03083 family)